MEQWFTENVLHLSCYSNGYFQGEIDEDGFIDNPYNRTEGSPSELTATSFTPAYIAPPLYIPFINPARSSHSVLEESYQFRDLRNRNSSKENALQANSSEIGNSDNQAQMTQQEVVEMEIVNLNNEADISTSLERPISLDENSRKKYSRNVKTLRCSKYDLVALLFHIVGRKHSRACDSQCALQRDRSFWQMNARAFCFVKNEKLDTILVILQAGVVRAIYTTTSVVI